jgi:hypothetical protein
MIEHCPMDWHYSRVEHHAEASLDEPLFDLNSVRLQ